MAVFWGESAFISLLSKNCGYVPIPNGKPNTNRYKLEDGLVKATDIYLLGFSRFQVWEILEENFPFHSLESQKQTVLFTLLLSG